MFTVILENRSGEQSENSLTKMSMFSAAYACACGVLAQDVRKGEMGRLKGLPG
jgi:hypothetical protein